VKPALIDTDIYAALRKNGVLIDDIDILIAGIALANNLMLVTHNTSHFSRIDGLEIQDWT
jgi:tRNA(fMet)-specific endonuclease VapC